MSQRRATGRPVRADGGAPADDTPEAAVEDLLERGREAMAAIEGYDQAAVDELVTAAAWAVYPEDRAREIAASAVEGTRMGDVEDKVTKLRTQVRGALADMTDAPSVGVIDRDPARGTIEVAKPVGAVGAVVPSTNPGATAAHIAMCALKGRNAIVLSASPGAEAACEAIVEHVGAELERVGAPRDLVQRVPGRTTKSKAYALMRRADLLQVTGSADNVRAGQESGTPNYCVGPGNVVSIIDRTADLEAAAADIAWSAGFDEGATCVNASALVVEDAIAEDLRAALEAAGGYRCDAEQRERVAATLFPDGHRNREAVARDPATLCDMAGVSDPAVGDAAFLLVDGEGIGEDDPLSGETLSPVVTVYTVPDFDAAIETARSILAHEGAGHSCTLHSTVDERAERVGREIDVGRIVINQPPLHLAGAFENGLDFALSLGCGTWAGNQFDDNLDYTYFLNTTTVARPTEAAPPDEEELFAGYPPADD